MRTVGICGLRRSAATRVDLTRNSAFTLALMDDTWSWRQRAVTSLKFGSPTHIRQESSLQLDIPEDLLVRHGVRPGAEIAHVILPIGRRPKHQLLNLRLIGPDGGSGHLLLRASIAPIQAEYLAALVDSSPAARVDGLLSGPLLEAICLFTPRVARSLDAPTSRGGMTDYLAEGLGFHVPGADIERWASKLAVPGRALCDSIGLPPDPESSSENVLLVMPLMEPSPASSAEIDSVVAAYASAIDALASSHDETLLAALANYGRQWDVLVECDIPLGRPSTITVVEDLPLEIDARGRVRHPVSLGDARSAHLQLAVDDRSLELAAGFQVVAPSGEPIGVFDDVRETREFAAVYTSSTSRPDVAVIEVRLKPVIDHRLVVDAVLLLTALSAVGAATMPFSLALLGLLVVPSTFATSLLLIREPASLGRRLMVLRMRSVLAFAAALWVIVAVQVVRHRGSL